MFCFFRSLSSFKGAFIGHVLEINTLSLLWNGIFSNYSSSCVCFFFSFSLDFHAIMAEAPEPMELDEAELSSEESKSNFHRLVFSQNKQRYINSMISWKGRIDWCLVWWKNTTSGHIRSKNSGWLSWCSEESLSGYGIRDHCKHLSSTTPYRKNGETSW